MASTPNAAEIAQGGDATAPVEGLFSLPAELRVVIYDHIFLKPERKSIEKRRSNNTEAARIDGRIILPPIMRVSASICEDASDVYQQHLRNVQGVLAEPEQALQKLVKRAEPTCCDACRFSPLRQLKSDRCRWRLEDNCKWKTRVDEVAAELRRAA
ncbi:hypothetical protein LTR17_005783 [Elasticomyces elasticus]|nr:hypothetical protein LTR17_005783 [Elasticomyces elasticus]